MLACYTKKMCLIFVPPLGLTIFSLSMISISASYWLNGRSIPHTRNILEAVHVSARENQLYASHCSRLWKSRGVKKAYLRKANDFHVRSWRDQWSLIGWFTNILCTAHVGLIQLFNSWCEATTGKKRSRMLYTLSPCEFVFECTNSCHWTAAWSTSWNRRRTHLSIDIIR